MLRISGRYAREKSDADGEKSKTQTKPFVSSNPEERRHGLLAQVRFGWFLLKIWKPFPEPERICEVGRSRSRGERPSSAFLGDRSATTRGKSIALFLYQPVGECICLIYGEVRRKIRGGRRSRSRNHQFMDNMGKPEEQMRGPN